jgi:hypothetical protein
VLGLIHVMGNLADPSKLGGGIAAAFVATIYGLVLANVFALPMGNKIKSAVKKADAALRAVRRRGHRHRPRREPAQHRIALCKGFTPGLEDCRAMSKQKARRSRTRITSAGWCPTPTSSRCCSLSFVVMYAVSSVNEGKFRVLSDSMVVAFRSADPHSAKPIQLAEMVGAQSFASDWPAQSEEKQCCAGHAADAHLDDSAFTPGHRHVNPGFWRKRRS